MINGMIKYNRMELGFYLTALGGNPIDRLVKLINGTSDSGYAGCSFLSDDWFQYVASTNGNKLIYVSNGQIVKANSYNSRLDDDIIKRYSHRPLEEDLLAFALNNKNADYLLDIVNDYLREEVIRLFDAEREAMTRIYTVINEDYEPLYNLDVTYEEQHSGTDTKTISGTESGTDGDTGTSTNVRSGGETLTKSGSEATTYAGGETRHDNTGSNTTTANSVYAFDSVNALPNDGSVVNHNKSESTEYNNRSDTTAFNNRQDSTSYNNLTDQRTDNLSHSHSRTSSGSEGFAHGEKITTRRFGNQGITKSTELLDDEIRTWSRIDFLQYVSDMVVKRITTI